MLNLQLSKSLVGLRLDKETVTQRQSRVAKAGGRWEEYVRLFLNEKLQDKGIRVIIGKNEREIKEQSKVLWKMFSIPIKASTVQESVWGDIDLVAVKSVFMRYSHKESTELLVIAPTT